MFTASTEVKRNSKYFEDFNLAKQGLIDVVTKYLHTYFEDRFDKGARLWNAEYQTNLSRFFSSHGQSGYSLALKSLDRLNAFTDNHNGDIQLRFGGLLGFAVRETGHATMHRDIVKYLVTNLVINWEIAFNKEMDARAASGFPLYSPSDAPGVDPQMAVDMAFEVILNNALDGTLSEYNVPKASKQNESHTNNLVSGTPRFVPLEAWGPPLSTGKPSAPSPAAK
ncbi:MAG: hypothetical protein WCW01_00085 [Gammaproteobacteria bacterium]|jgi:hypothetical protein